MLAAIEPCEGEYRRSYRVEKSGFDNTHSKDKRVKLPSYHLNANDPDIWTLINFV